MARPIGAKNKKMPGDPGYKKPGRKAGSTVFQLADDQILAFKARILELLASGKATTITDAADKVGVEAARVYAWGKNDPDFRDMLALSREVVADRLEKELAEHANFIPKMMILKGLRPMYRDSYKTPMDDNKLRELLEALKNVKDKDKEEKQETVEEIEEPKPAEILGITDKEENSN